MPKITKRSKLNRQSARCDTCGKHCEKPYVYQHVPSYTAEIDIPKYSKSAPKTKRLDLTGSRRVRTRNYCDQMCYDNA